MRLSYFSNKFFPAKAANTVQILSMCEAFKNNAVDITLVAFKSEDYKNNTSIFDEYGIKNKFNIVLLKPLNSYYLRELQLVFYLIKDNKRIDSIYSRSLLFSIFARLFFPSKKLIYELHDFAKSIFFKRLDRKSVV